MHVGAVAVAKKEFLRCRPRRVGVEKTPAGCSANVLLRTRQILLCVAERSIHSVERGIHLVGSICHLITLLLLQCGNAGACVHACMRDAGHQVYGGCQPSPQVTIMPYVCASLAAAGLVAPSNVFLKWSTVGWFMNLPPKKVLAHMPAKWPWLASPASPSSCWMARVGWFAYSSVVSGFIASSGVMPAAFSNSYFEHFAIGNVHPSLAHTTQGVSILMPILSLHHIFLSLYRHY